MSLHISVSGSFSAQIKDFQSKTKQVKYAMAAALTKTAIKVRDLTRDRMRQQYTIRREIVVRGLTYVPADKRQVNPTAKVYSLDGEKFLWRHEHGAIKGGLGGGSFAGTGAGRLAIPTKNLRPVKTALVARSQWPSALGKWTKGSKTGAFIIGAGPGKGERTKLKSGAAVRPALAVRVGRGKTRSLKVLYRLSPRAVIKRTLGLRDIGARAMSAFYPRQFRIELENALRNRW